MATKAIFLQGDSLLIPETSAEQTAALELANQFHNPDIFSIPALDIPALNDPAESSEIHIVSVLPNIELPAGWKSVPVRQTLALGCPHETSKILRACHIAQWRQDSVYCGRCGTKNNNVPGEPQRHCPSCGKTEFPRICPAIIVLITDDQDRILLAHNKRFKTGVYSHISGFNEAGETLEETVAREIKEEVDIEVCGIEYIKSQPWPFPNSLMVGFKARYLKGEIKPDGKEIEDAKWFTKNDIKNGLQGNGLPQLPAEGSLSRIIINNWLEPQ